VLQGAILAKSVVVMCSEHGAYHSDISQWHQVLVAGFFGNGAKSIYNEMGHSKRHLGICFHSENVATSDSNMLAEMRVLSKSRLLDATDMRDKVFRVLSLSNTSMTCFHSPYYSMSPSDIFT
jgi:hypothetical protein